MKKSLVLFLSLVCVLCLIVCNNILPEKKSVSNNVSYSDVEGVFIEIESMCIYPDITTLIISWNNNTKHTVTYGEMYWIERLENGEWVGCSLKDNIFTLVGYTLNASEKVDKEYRITDRFDISNPGTYRFRSTCSLGMGDKKDCSVWAEFVIE